MNYEKFRRLQAYFKLKNFVLFGLGLAALNYAIMLYRNHDPAYRDQKTDPNNYCEPFAQKLGPSFYYPVKKDSKEPQRVEYEWREYKTSAGFNMRVPAGMGYLNHPNQRCEMQSGTFQFLWIDGKLLPLFDYTKDVHRSQGTLVEYFVRFDTLTDPPRRKHEIESWKLEGAFRLPRYPRILLLPFGGYDLPESRPMDKNDKAKWNAELMLEDARDIAGNATMFRCNKFRFKEIDQEIYVEVVYDDAGTKCMAGINFTDRAGGRLDIYGPNFLDRGAIITNAVIKELNSYIFKE